MIFQSDPLLQRLAQECRIPLACLSLIAETVVLEDAERLGHCRGDAGTLRLTVTDPTPMHYHTHISIQIQITKTNQKPIMLINKSASVVSPKALKFTRVWIVWHF